MKQKLAEVSVQRNEISNLPSFTLDLYTRKIFNVIIDCVSEHIVKTTGSENLAAKDYWDNIPVSITGIDNGGVDVTSRVFKFPAELVAPRQNWSRLRALIATLDKVKIAIPMPVNIQWATQIEAGNTKDSKRQELINEWTNASVTSFYNKIEFATDQNLIAVSVDMNFYRYLFNLEGGFTIFKSQVIRELKSVYSIKIYELLSMWKSVGEVSISIEKLRILTGTTESYTSPSDFRAKVIEKAKKDLEKAESSDLTFEYDVTRDKFGKIEKFNFKIHKNIAFSEFEEYDDILPKEIEWDYKLNTMENLARYGIKLNTKTKTIATLLESVLLDTEIAKRVKEWHVSALRMNKGAEYMIGCMMKYLEPYRINEILAATPTGKEIKEIAQSKLKKVTKDTKKREGKTLSIGELFNNEN